MRVCTLSYDGGKWSHGILHLKEINDILVVLKANSPSSLKMLWKIIVGPEERTEDELGQSNKKGIVNFHATPYTVLQQEDKFHLKCFEMLTSKICLIWQNYKIFDHLRLDYFKV